MRVLMLTQFYPPYIGGEERHVRTLSQRLAARGHEVAVATLGNQELPAYEDDQGVRVYRIRGTMQRIEKLFSQSDRRHAPPFPDPELGLALREVIRREQPQIVHAHNWLNRSFLPLKSWSGARLVLTVHDHSLICPKKKLIHGDDPCSGPQGSKCLSCAPAHYGKAKGVPVMLSNVAMSRAERAAVDMYVPVSRAVAQDNGLLDSKLPVRVIPNFVPDDLGTQTAPPHPNLAQLPAGDFMLFVGAFGRYKGLDVLIRAYADLVDAPPLVIIGYSTPEYPVRTVDLPPGVIVLRDWPHEAVMQAWQRSLFGLIPSIWSDPCPTVAMEGMSTGRALIASRIGGLMDLVVDGETGLLVEPGDHSALTQAMARLLADRDLCRRMGEAGRRHVTGFQASTVIQRIEEMYAELHAR
ncbi:MAG TPA: glycosyltransferase family 4 protein [Herpetosiphonaceae bacterium]